MFTRFFGHDFSVTISRLMLLCFVAVLPCIGGCGEDDNPIVDDDHDHDHDAPLHADVDGFFLEVDGKEVYRQFQGTDSGGLTVGVGQEIEVHAVFLDANGAEAHLDEVEAVDEHGHEEEFGLGLSDYDSPLLRSIWNMKMNTTTVKKNTVKRNTKTNMDTKNTVKKNWRLDLRD